MTSVICIAIYRANLRIIEKGGFTAKSKKYKKRGVKAINEKLSLLQNVSRALKRARF
jgi:hypothetical protein